MINVMTFPPVKIGLVEIIPEKKAAFCDKCFTLAEIVMFEMTGKKFWRLRCDCYRTSNDALEGMVPREEEVTG